MENSDRTFYIRYNSSMISKDHAGVLADGQIGGEPMNPRVKSVRPNPDYTLTIVFDNGETRCFEVEPYLEKGIFKELRALKNFNSVNVFLGSIQWRGGQELCPDTLYMISEPIPETLGSSDCETARVATIAAGDRLFASCRREGQSHG
jgi:hypothetical protein